MDPEVTPEVTPEPVPVVEPTPEPTPEPVVDDEGKEPGGDDPQAVRARKEYRARKAAQAEAATQREENIRLQERLRTIEEERTRHPAQPEKVYTIAEINTAVEAGTVSRADADKYIEEVIVPRRVEMILERREASVAQKAPIERARQEIGEYLKYIPGLNDRTSAEFRKVSGEYEQLIADGLPDNDVTRRLAVKAAHGSLESLRKKHELAELSAQPRTIPSDTGGGGGTARSNGKVDISKAPATMVASWDSEGVDQATRERRYRIYLDLKARQHAR